MKTLGSRLRHVIKEWGGNESALARKAGVPQSSIHRLVNDKTKSPKYQNITNISRVLGITPEYLLRGDTENKAEEPPLPSEYIHQTSHPVLSVKEVARRGSLTSEFLGTKEHIPSFEKIKGMGFWFALKGELTPWSCEGETNVLFDTGKSVKANTVVLVHTGTSDPFVCRLVALGDITYLKPLEHPDLYIERTDRHLIAAVAVEMRTVL